jgi:hypothetical protein
LELKMLRIGCVEQDSAFQAEQAICSGEVARKDIAGG